MIFCFGDIFKLFIEIARCQKITRFKFRLLCCDNECPTLDCIIQTNLSYSAEHAYSVLRQICSEVLSYGYHNVVDFFDKHPIFKWLTVNLTEWWGSSVIIIISEHYQTLRRMIKTYDKRLVNSLLWRHNDRDRVSNHQHHDCLPNRLFRRRSKKTSNSASLAIHRSPVNTPHKWRVTRKMFPFDDVIM